MKIFIFFISTAVFCLTPGNSFSQEKIIIEKDKLVTVDNVFKIIKKQTDFNFIYPKSLFKDSPKIQLKKGEIKVSKLIDTVLATTNFSFELTENNTIFFKGKTEISTDIEQTINISGQILDETGFELPGATIIEVGTNNGTTSDFDGNFSLNVTSENSQITVSYIGFETQTLTVGSRTKFSISMGPDSESLDEVIVVGYGTKTKKTLTGSVSAVKGEVLIHTPSANISANLQGRLPGLTANQTTGEPGRDDPNILIRGSGTFGDNSPLIIIDGVPRENMSRLNPGDIENISVLKDASAAIYGARAANGVIIVTTKRGKRGKPVFNVSFETAFSNPAQLPDMLDSATYAEIFNEGEWYAQGRPDESSYTPYYSEEAIQKFKDGSDPVLYPNTNWVDETLKKNAMQSRFSMSASGGSEKVSYFLSFSYLDQEGNYINNPTRYQQYNMRAKVDVDLTDNLTVGVNLSGINMKKEYSSAETLFNFYNILQALPTLPAVYPNGLIAPGRLGQNPLLLDRRGYNNIGETPIYTTFTASYKIPFVKGLKFDASFNYDQDNQTNKLWEIPYNYHEFNVNTGNYDEKTLGPLTPELTDRYDKFTTKMFNYRFTYENTFGDHNMSAMVGQEQQENMHSWVQAFRRNYVSTVIDEIDVGSSAAEDKDNGGASAATAYNNYFGRFNYDFKSKYLVEFLFRYDGSQVFPEGERYGFFPGVSAGWVLSEESFIKDNLPFVDHLKLRVSHGKLGDDSVGQYQYMQSFYFGNNYVFGTSDVPGVYSSTLPNPNITWEVSVKTDIGIEADFFGGLLGTEVTFWKENRSNILTSRYLSTPSILGFPSLPDENIGEVDGRGFELALLYKNTIGDVGYSINGNVSYANSEIVFMDETPNSEDYQNQTGKPVGAELYYETDGVFNTQEELDAYPYSGSSGLGDIKIIDKNNDGVINDNDRVRNDKTSTPEWVFGLSTGLTYENFDLNLF
ncbi:TonB-dependent receptor, partial [Flavicella sp.]|uniref:SusC/RagA family TonB-linked outer membrane protein n=1 Tax=Flavicella sp. TaxID=2957742 RepID=UPI003016B59C